MSGLRLAAITLIAAAVAGSTGAATPRVDGPLLTFSSLGLCATDLQGHMFRLTGPHQSGWNLSWSPDGSQLAFVSGPTRVSFTDAEGDNKGGLSFGPSSDGEHYSSNVGGLAWSPDSRSLAGVLLTAVHYGGEHSVLWVNGSRSRTLFYGGIIGQPSWSPDGSRIAFSDWSTSKAYVIDSDGRNVREVLDSADRPVWSPDGQRLAYVVLDADRQSVGLAVAQADGSGQMRLTDGRVLSPAWSPDGSTIAFTRALGASNQIDVIKPDGTDERTVARDAVWFSGPVWSPSGDAIAYARQVEPSGTEPAGLGVVSPDGTNERIIQTSLPGAALSSPAWRRPAPLPTHRRACVITGTPRADVLRGKKRGDVLYGGAGDDRIHGAGGNDVLIGGPGHDRLFGGAGKDVFQAQDAQRDYLFGGAGSDRGTWDIGRDRTKSVKYYDSE
jgi:Tol biopolymer transport system component